MEYWQGYMNWPLDAEWKCETCGERAGLTWGMPHAVCRCNRCHTEYTMRDNTKENRPMVNVPISCVKDEYKAAAKTLYETHKKPIDEFTEEQWNELVPPSPNE